MHPVTNKKKPVLIVDDNPDILVLLSKLLETEGHETATASSGHQALQYLKKEEPHIVLLDYMMPDISGIEVLKEIKKNYPLTQVLIITGRGDENVATTFMKLGAVDYISKPFENKQVLNSLKRAALQRSREVKKLLDHQAQEDAQRTLQEEKKNLSVTIQQKNIELETVNRKLKSINKALKEKNEEISRLEQMYHEVFDKAGDGIVTLDMNGSILMANRMAASILQSSRLKGSLFSEYLTQVSREKLQTLFSSLGTGRVLLEEVEVEIPGQDGTKTLNLRAVPLHGKDSIQGIEILITDITQKIYQQRAVKKLEERAIVAGLSRHLSHVLLNAVTSAGGYLNKIKKGLDNPEPLLGYFTIVDREITKMEDVVRGYQDYVNSMTLKPESLQPIHAFLESFLAKLDNSDDADIDRVIRPIRSDFTLNAVNLAARKAATFIDPYFLELGLAYLIKGIVFHALKTEKPPVGLSLELSRKKQEARIALTSINVNTPDDIIMTMYNPWEHQMLHQTFEDWGVTIANNIAERHNGALEVVSVDEGTRYTIRIPVVSADTPRLNN